MDETKPEPWVHIDGPPAAVSYRSWIGFWVGGVAIGLLMLARHALIAEMDGPAVAWIMLSWTVMVPIAALATHALNKRK